MAELNRIDNLEFDADITAVAMDNRFIVVGQADGKVAVVYATGMPKFQPVEVSKSKITAVCADDDEDYFYVGDEEGNVYALNNKGKVLASSKMPEKAAGAVLMIMNKTGIDFSFSAYSAKGWTKFIEVTSNFSIENSGTNEKDGSVDGDGTLHTDQEGDNPLLQYNAKTGARLVATLVIKENNQKYRNFNSVFAHAIADNATYESNIQSAVTTLSVRKGKGLGDEVRKLEFAVPVKQVISCRHHTGGEAEADDIYVLLCDGDLLRYNGTQLFDEGVDTDDLEKEQVLDYYPEDIDESEKYLGGFAVYEKKVVIYGSDGLYVADV